MEPSIVLLDTRCCRDFSTAEKKQVRPLKHTLASLRISKVRSSKATKSARESL